ncbi:MAG: purine-nucleoside phosphorylase [Candidatus Marinimicrobia bacterium]|nr:purine-nucleoside phosphorylase [Candidatus Neomarinimicrobiota bacterium]
MKQAIEYVSNQLGQKPDVAVVLGSGLGSFGDQLRNKRVIPYKTIPGYPQTTVVGHSGQLSFGSIGGKNVLAAQGRFHYYEGHDMETIVKPIDLFSGLGVSHLIITNSAGSLKDNYPPGTIMGLNGHMDCTYRGDDSDPNIVNDSKYHDEFFLKIFSQVAKSLNISVEQGCYCWTMGPAYETPAEVQHCKTLGGQAVGMSTVPEIQAAAKLGISTLGISLLTNYAAGISKTELTHDEVIETANLTGKTFVKLLTGIIQELQN